MKKSLMRVLVLSLLLMLLGGTAVFGAGVTVGRVNSLLAAATGCTKIELNWKSVSGADGYRLERYQADSKEWNVVADTKNVTATDTGLQPGTKYTYRVKAYRKNGKTNVFGSASEKVAVVTPPEQPSMPKAAPSSNASLVELQWEPTPGATGYFVMQKDVTSGKSYVRIAKTKETHLKVPFEAAPGTVRFKIKAYAKHDGITAKGEESPVLKLNLKPESVSPLTEQGVSSDSVTLVWTAAAGASCYEVYLRDEVYFEYNKIAEVGGLTYTVTGLEPGVLHKFGVKTVADYHGNMQRSPFGPILTACAGLDSVNDFTYLLNEDNTAVLSWSEVGGAEGYEVEQSADGKKNWNKIADVNGTSYETADPLENGKRYFFRVRAHASANDVQIYSAYSSKLELQPLPDTPVITRAAAAAQHGICLEWTAVGGADGYELYFRNETDGEWKLLSRSPLHNQVFLTYKNENGRQTVYYLDRGLTRSGTYQYRVRAYAEKGGTFRYTAFSDVCTFDYTYTAEPKQSTVTVSSLFSLKLDLKEQVLFTSEDMLWRNRGEKSEHNVYDLIPQSSLTNNETQPLQFTCHEGETWMLQPWKGQYGGIFYGGELGVYKKYLTSSGAHLDKVTEADQLMMELNVSRRQLTGKWKTEIHRPYSSCGWLNGFKPVALRLVNPFDKNGAYSDLRLEMRITAADFDMRNALVAALQNDSHYTVEPVNENSLDLYITYQ